LPAAAATGAGSYRLARLAARFGADVAMRELIRPSPPTAIGPRPQHRRGREPYTDGGYTTKSPGYEEQQHYFRIKAVPSSMKQLMSWGL
jgi:hypothetical protein